MRLFVQGRFIDRLSMLLTAPKVNSGIQNRWMLYLQQVDGSLASKVGGALATLHPLHPQTLFIGLSLISPLSETASHVHDFELPNQLRAGQCPIGGSRMRGFEQALASCFAALQPAAFSGICQCPCRWAPSWRRPGLGRQRRLSRRRVTPLTATADWPARLHRRPWLRRRPGPLPHPWHPRGGASSSCLRSLLECLTPGLHTPRSPRASPSCSTPVLRCCAAQQPLRMRLQMRQPCSNLRIHSNSLCALMFPWTSL